MSIDRDLTYIYSISGLSWSNIRDLNNIILLCNTTRENLRYFRNYDINEFRKQLSLCISFYMWYYMSLLDIDKNSYDLSYNYASNIFQNEFNTLKTILNTLL